MSALITVNLVIVVVMIATILKTRELDRRLRTTQCQIISLWACIGELKKELSNK